MSVHVRGLYMFFQGASYIHIVLLSHLHVTCPCHGIAEQVFHFALNINHSLLLVQNLLSDTNTDYFWYLKRRNYKHINFKTSFNVIRQSK
jgi:hypothetical protein